MKCFIGPGSAFKLRSWEAEADEFSEFKASLVYGLRSSKTAKAIQRNPSLWGGGRRKSLTGSLIIFREGSSGEGKMLQKMEVTEKKLIIGRAQTR